MYLTVPQGEGSRYLQVGNFRGNLDVHLVDRGYKMDHDEIEERLRELAERRATLVEELQRFADNGVVKYEQGRWWVTTELDGQDIMDLFT